MVQLAGLQLREEAAGAAATRDRRKPDGALPAPVIHYLLGKELVTLLVRQTTTLWDT